MASPEPIILYRSLMEALKPRIACLRRLADGSLSIGDNRFNWELAALQLRIILELVALASLCAHRNMYAAVHAQFAEHWNAARLLKGLASINPDFYPQPVRFEHVKEEGVRHFARIVDGYLTQDEFVRLYDVCSKAIHTPNPFGDMKPIDFGLSLGAWVQRIHGLLDTHFIRLHGVPQLWVVQMTGGLNGSVQIAVAEPKTV